MIGHVTFTDVKICATMYKIPKLERKETPSKLSHAFLYLHLDCGLSPHRWVHRTWPVDDGNRVMSDVCRTSCRWDAFFIHNRVVSSSAVLGEGIDGRVKDGSRMGQGMILSRLYYVQTQDCIHHQPPSTPLPTFVHVLTGHPEESRRWMEFDESCLL